MRRCGGSVPADRGHVPSPAEHQMRDVPRHRIGIPVGIDEAAAPGLGRGECAEAVAQRLLERFESFDHILIDTAGRSPAAPLRGRARRTGPSCPPRARAAWARAPPRRTRACAPPAPGFRRRRSPSDDTPAVTDDTVYVGGDD